MGKVWDILAPRNLELGPLAGLPRGGSPWRNWTLARDEDDIAWLVFDKPGASADTHEFGGMTDVAAIEARLTQAHAVVDRLDRLGAPTVAVIHGYCLGGGLEIALACDYRIAVEDARLGLPEVMLGLHPGLGGTVRLPRLINPLEAMTLMLTGRNTHAGRAKVLGLVDAVVPERHVQAAA